MGLLFIFLFIIIGCQYAVQAFLGNVLGLNVIWVDLLSSLIFATIYASLEFAGKEKLKNPNFYKKVAIIFGLFVGMSVLEFILELFLYGFLPLSYIWIALILDFLVAFLFAIINYPDRKKYAFKDPRFHSTVVVYFAVFAIYTFLDIYVLR